ncbi:MAG: carboxypeptidase regulatory-like domain-containing protein [Terriglobia bacterium]|nr:carboxypeptidase regulatory-like domain-containing protein [Terriglobia bacterium]
MLRRSSVAVCVLLFTVFGMLVGTSLAQDATGTVLGTVVDPQGSVIPNVQVTVTNTATAQKSVTKSGPDGSFRVLNLPIGEYTVAAEGAGFQKLVTSPQKLQINQNLRIDLHMKVGSTEQTVEVTTGAVAVETVNSTVGESVSGRSIQDLPLNGRDTLSLALSQPGVTETNDDTGAAGQFSIAGGRSDSVTFLLDGGVNNNLLDNSVVYNPNPDTVAEFRVLQNNYTAEYGRNGGGIVSVVTKSGTNQFHGSVFDYLRNDAMDANSYFNKVNGLPRDVLKRNQFGATLGGPIVKDKFFFFVGYQGQRQSRVETPSSGGTTTVFTPAELGGDFSQSADKNAVAAFLAANPYFQPDSNLASQGIIDPTKIDPVAEKYIAAGLIPTAANGELAARGSSTDNRNELTVKLDYAITPNDKLSVTLGESRVDQLDPFRFANVNGFPNIYKTNDYFSNIAYVKTFSSTLLNEFRFTGQRNNHQQALPGKNLPKAADLGVGITPDFSAGPPLLSFDSGMNIGFSYQGPTTLVNNTFSYSDTLSWVKGRHTFKFGGGFTPYQNNTLYDFIGDGWFDFYSGAGTNGSGSGFADFLMGIPGDYFQYPDAPSNIRSKNTFIFGQDEWRVGRRLVLTYGLRYEYSTPKLDTKGRSFSIIPGLQSTRFTNAPEGTVFPGDKGAPNGANFPDKNDFAPRFGFAFDPLGDGKWSIRGGIGVFYDILKGEDNLQFNGQPPFFSSVGLFFDSPQSSAYACPNGAGTSGSGFLCDPFGSSGSVNPFPSTPPAQNIDFGAAGFLPINGGGAVYLVDPHIRTPYTYQYNLSVEHELARGTLLEIAYVGSSSHKLTSLQDINPMDGSGARTLNENPALDACNNDPNNWLGGCYANLPEFRNVGTQSYNALDTRLTRQLTDTAGLGRTYFTFGYTWSHSIDNVSGFRERSYQVPAGNPKAFRASSDQDLRHRITFSGGWDMAVDRWWGSGPKRLTQGWSIFPIFTWRTGFPYDISANFNDAYDPSAPGPSGIGDPILGYANVVGPTNIYNPRKPQDLGWGSTGAYWFDPNSFSNSCEYVDPANGCPNGYGSPYGNLPRNHFRGPHKTNLDMTLAKTTKITERVTMQLRVDAFNIFNRAQFKNPDTNLYSNTFGQITDTYDPRILQLGARFSF